MKPVYVLLALIVGLCHHLSQAAECTTSGRFPNKDTEDCRGYTLCLQGGITNYTQYKIPCPEGSIYSHIEKQCTNSTDYQCLPTYNCTIVGNLVDPKNRDCNSFIACPQGLNELVTARLVKCSPNLVYSPIDDRCVTENEYLCPTLEQTFSDLVEDNLLIKANVTVNGASYLSVKPFVLFAIIDLMLIMYCY